MSKSKSLACLGILTVATLSIAQSAPPTAYTIIEGMNGGASPGTTTLYRSGNKVVMESNIPASGGTPASHSFALYDLARHTNWSWSAASNPVTCGVGTFSDDWGDPFDMTSQLNDGVAKGQLKAGGAETMAGVTTTLYTGTIEGSAVKLWFDKKDGLVVKAVATMAGGRSMPLADVRRVILTPPTANHFVLPAACAGVKPPPTPGELIAAETGDSAANFVSGIYGPGSKSTCTIAFHVVQTKTMAPITRKFQIAIDTTYQVGSPNPPAYAFGEGADGTSTFSGGGIHEVTNQIRNGVLRIVNPPASFELALNVITPGEGAGSGGVYRQCFGPVTNLYYVMKDQSDPFKGGDYLYAKAGKYAAGH